MQFADFTMNFTARLRDLDSFIAQTAAHNPSAMLAFVSSVNGFVGPSLMRQPTLTAPTFTSFAYAAPSPVRAFSARLSGASSDVEEICDVIPDICEDVVKDADAVFFVIDENGDGTISRDELMAHMTRCGYSEQAVNTIFEKVRCKNKFVMMMLCCGHMRPLSA